MSRSRARTLALLAVPLALATGCGDATPTVPAREGRAEVALDDYLLDPQELSARPGPLTLTVRNRGRIGHSLRLRLDEDVRVSVLTLLPGERETVTRSLPAGSYRMYCAIGNHEELGMWGTLMVTR